MTSYRSIGHVSKNENGEEELNYEREITLVEWAAYVIKNRTFNVPETVKEAFVLLPSPDGGVWVNKHTGETPCNEDQWVLFSLREDLKTYSTQLDKYL